MVLGISASARAWGNCEIAVKTALIAAAARGAATGFVRLTDLRIDPCRGCFACLSGDGRCVLGDDLAGLLQRLDAADGLVLASPVYFGLPPACLVALLDRLLARTPREGAEVRAGAAVTITIMGNVEWRGVAEPVANAAAGLLGFEPLESLRLVAEGPGDVLADPRAVAAIESAGRRLASGGGGAGERAPGAARACPVCRSDFVRLRAGGIECPVCGERGDAETYFRDGRFRSVGGERRWGRAWLRRHADSWIRPSIARYRAGRREAIGRIAEIKRRYAALEGGK